MIKSKLEKYYNKHMENRVDSRVLFKAMVDIVQEHHPEYTEDQAMNVALDFFEYRMMKEDIACQAVMQLS